MRAWIFASGPIAALALLAACGNPAATPERQDDATTTTTEATTAATPATTEATNDNDSSTDRGEGADRAASGADAASLPATHTSGAPSWASNRRQSAAERAQAAFDRNGEDFGVRTRAEYVDRAHAFLRNPPEGTLTASRRNGDRLYYDPAGNVFAVANSEGAPRTMFKPEEGMAYWREQEERIRSGGQQRARGRSAEE